MGAGIARIFADGGASVRLAARRQESLDAARERAGGAGGRATRAGRGWTARAAGGGATVATPAGRDGAPTGAGLVVEPVVEEVEPKRGVLARAEELAAPDAILT